MNNKHFYSFIATIATLSLLVAIPQSIQAAPSSTNTLGNEASIVWNTFWGETTTAGDGVLVDKNGYIYIVGYSGGTWGDPVNPYAGMGEAFAAKFDNNGVLLWNTFLGSANDDQGFGIATDGNGNIYVSGRSSSSWGTPVNNHAGGYDTFVAKLDYNGILQWNTFLGSAGTDQNLGVAADESGNSYVVGNSDATWGNPINNHAGGYDAFVAKLNTYGEMQWNTFFGSPGYDSAAGVAVGKSGNIYIGGDSSTSWGNPVVPFGTGSRDGFVAKLHGDGTLIWNTFSGGYYEWARGLALDGSENIYIVGYNYGTLGIPDPYAGGDAFASKFDNNGLMIWSTLLGSSEFDQGFSIALNEKGNVYVTGDSYATWGNPVNSHTDGSDAFAAKLNNNGSLQWNTFLGSTGYDQGMGIATDGSETAYVTGYSCNAWGTPLHAHPGDACVLFVAKLEQSPLPTIAARFHENEIHGYDWPLGAPVTLTIDDPDNEVDGYYSDTQSVVASDADPNETFVEFRLWENNFELKNGQIITMSDGTTTKTHVVAVPRITGIISQSGISQVEGLAAPFAEIWVDFRGATRHETADGAGHWLADFHVPGDEDFETQTTDIDAWNEGEARVQDEDGDSTSTNWGRGLLMLELESDGSPQQHVFIRHWPARQPVTLWIDDPDTQENPDYTDSSPMRRWSDGMSRLTIDWTGVFEVRPGFTITVTDGYVAKTMTVPLLAITGYDLTNDTISGIANPFATIRVPVAHPGGQEDVEPAVVADSEGNWLADFRVPGYIFDLQPGDCAEPQTYDQDSDHTVLRDWCIPPWTLKGFYQPVDMNGIYNLVKGGSTVPFKFEVFAGSIELTDIADIESFTYTQIACDTNASTDSIETTVMGGNSLRYDPVAGQFIYNWKTPRTADTCYRVTVTTIDGSSLLAYFKLK